MNFYKNIMPFISLVFFSALLLELIGSYISISGLAAKTGPIVVIIAVALDLAKIVIATVLYKMWKRLNFLLKIYLLPVLIVLISVTSTGAFGYLSQEFGSTILSQEKNQSQLVLLEEDYAKKQMRKKQIDDQIEKLPSDQVNQRRRLTELYANELTLLNKSILELEDSIPKLKMASIEERGTNGTVGSISKNLNIPPEDVINYLSIFMVCFIDPLAIVLLIVGNFLIEERKKDLKLFKEEQEKLLKEKEEQEKSLLNNGKKENIILPENNIKEVEKIVEVIKEVKVFDKHLDIKENTDLIKDYQQKDNNVLSVVEHIAINKNIKQDYALWNDYNQKQDNLLSLDKEFNIIKENVIIEEKENIVNKEPIELSNNGIKKLNPAKYDFNVLLSTKTEDKDHDLDEMEKFIEGQSKAAV